MDNLSLLANLPNHVNGKHLNVYRWLDGCGWSIDVDGHHFENHSFNLLVHEVLDYLPRLRDYIFSETNLWLKPTNEK